ncbi:hypothetical protein [Roseinatronobacter sp. NSM]|uniref:hypothetical protein n=1 Tax=Roseinatronobacter sp. NSM TaxID=3457785 RepID=UPI0040366651
MKMIYYIRYLAVLGCCFVGFGATAQTTIVPVRAGEHSVFTRLTVQIPEANDWRLSQDGHLGILAISGPALDFDLSQTFARIPRTRLASLREIDSGLELKLACDCVIRASEDLPRYLVIDIVEIETSAMLATRNSPRPQTRPDQSQLIEQAVPAQPRAHAQLAGESLAALLTGRASATQDRPSLLLTQVVGASAPDILPTPQPARPVPEPLSALGSMTTELGRALSEAVGQGLLTPNQSAQPDPPPDATTMHTRPAPDSSAQTADISGHFTVTDSVSAARGAASRALQNDTRATCPPAHMMDPSGWAGAATDTPAPYVPGQLFNETDMLDLDATRALAKHYLYLGFGAEARLILSLISPQPPENQVLEVLSHLIDLDPLPENLTLSGLEACGEMGVLWQALVILPQDLPAGYPVTYLTQAVQALPPHLRLHLGPYVIRHLAAQGHLSPAHSIRDSLDRVTQMQSDPLRIAQAALDLPRASAQDAQRLEQNLISEPTFESLTFLLQRQQDLDEPVSAELAQEAQDALRALRGSEEGHRLATLLAKGVSRSGRHADAFTLARENDAALPEPQTDALMADLLLDLVREADDRSFVTLVFEYRPWEGSVPWPVKSELASRLSRLGFDVQAQLLIAEPATTQESDNTGTGPVRDIATALDATPLPDISAPEANATDVAERNMEASITESVASEERPAQPAMMQTAQEVETGSVQPLAVPLRNENAVPSGLLNAGRNTVRDSTLLRERLAELLPARP